MSRRQAGSAGSLERLQNLSGGVAAGQLAAGRVPVLPRVGLAVGFQVSVRALAGYALARFNFRGRQAIAQAVLATRVIPLPLQAIPIFQALKWGHPLQS
ncbi:MAG: hypothetical protein KME26_33105 [Oscillatoria princeps RMCB-10]|jgi:multiple sugar transport system permease protein|nr:hypothetical protein [Oscillatoria princeps RMCB-10]